MAGRLDRFSPAVGLTFPLQVFIISSRMAVHKGRAAGADGGGPMTEGLALSAFCTAVVIVSVLGGILPLAVMLNHTRLQVYLSFSAGAMLGAAFFHMLPEAVRVGSPETLYWTAFGLLALFFLERFFSFHHHEAHDAAQSVQGAGARPAPNPNEPTLAGDVDHHGHQVGAPSHPTEALRWGPAAVGLSVHSLVGGIALASAVAADFDVGRGAFGAGLGVFVATMVHKPADALTITALMLEIGHAPGSRVPRQPGIRPDDPGGGRRLLGRHTQLPAHLLRHLDSSGPGVLRRDVPLHRAERPAARVAIPLARPGTDVGRAPGRLRADGGDGPGRAIVPERRKPQHPRHPGSHAVSSV